MFSLVFSVLSVNLDQVTVEETKINKIKIFQEKNSILNRIVLFKGSNKLKEKIEEPIF